ncbi:nucleotide exchange factor GrpE [Dactylosporangium sp. NPDC050688]|uniref:nucleotide exchange factor GrpE n=1 Tax=Dactylosporangium sp. NPDC050688 TaxID=3157217 RepID=UPI00340E1213
MADDNTVASAEDIAELTERWRRAAADVENTRKWADRHSARQREEERLAVTAAWLPVLDNLDLALQHAGADPATIVQGVAGVREQAVGVLARLGFMPVGEVGEPFDPVRHEAAEVDRDSDAPPGTVVRVLRPGYGDGDHLLRPAVVAVSAPPGLETQETAQDTGQEPAQGTTQEPEAGRDGG